MSTEISSEGIPMEPDDSDAENIETSEKTSKTIREINLAGLVTLPSTEKEGTPNKSIGRLLRQCVALHDDFEADSLTKSVILFATNKNEKKTKKKLISSVVNDDIITPESVLQLAHEIEDSKRDSLSTFQTEQITKIILKAVKAIESRTAKEKQNKSDIVCISQLWYSILVKSISDVAQFGSVVRNAHLIMKDHPSTDVPPCIAYLSSDLIAAAEATTLGRQIKHPYLILSTKKTSNITQQIILQKREIAATALFLVCMFDNDSGYLSTILRQYISTNANDAETITKANKHAEMISEVYKDMNKTQGIDDPFELVDNFKATFSQRFLRSFSLNSSTANNYNQHDPLMLQIQKWADDTINGVGTGSPEQDFRDGTYKSFIDNINAYSYSHEETDTNYIFFKNHDNTGVEGIINIFQEMIMFGSKDNMFVIPRWIHQLSVDIHTSRVENQIDKLSPAEETNMSIAEIIAATEDATYGHDFKSIEGIRFLGEVFMNKVLAETNGIKSETKDQENIFNYKPLNYHRHRDKSVSKGSYEKRCIIEVLERNRYVTITQYHDQYVVIFNSNENFLTYDLEKIPLQDTTTKWNIGQTPLYSNRKEPGRTITHRKIYMSIDYSKGTPSFFEHISNTKNAIRSYNRVDPNTYAFDFIMSNNYDTLLQEINSETGFNEIMDVTTMFDGAAPIGGVPYFFTQGDADPSSTKTPVPHINIITTSGGILEMKTFANNQSSQDITKWLETQSSKGGLGKNITTLSKKIKVSIDQYKTDDLSHTIDVCNRDLGEMYEFGIILGMFFNAVYSKSEIIQNYELILTAIETAILKEKNSEGSRETRSRKQTSRYGSEVDAYQEMITTTKNTTIQLIVTKLLEFNDNDKVIDTIMRRMNGLIKPLPTLSPQSSSSSSSYAKQDSRIFDIINDVFNVALIFETNTKDKSVDGYNETDKEDEAFLDCMITMLSGALKISSSNMTSGNFLSGETLLSNGVIRPEIIQDFEEAKNISKTKDQIVEMTLHQATSIQSRTGANTSLQFESPLRIHDTNNAQHVSLSANPRMQTTGKMTGKTTEKTDILEPVGIGIDELRSDDDSRGNNTPRSAQETDMSESETEQDPPQTAATAAAAQETDMSGSETEQDPPQTAATAAAQETDMSESETDMSESETEQGPPQTAATAAAAATGQEPAWLTEGSRPIKKQKTYGVKSNNKGGRNISHKKNKRGNNLTQHRSTKSNKKVKSSRKGSRKAHKERKPQRTRRLNK